jgi:hypothetical protein
MTMGKVLENFGRKKRTVAASHVNRTDGPQTEPRQA